MATQKKTLTAGLSSSMEKTSHKIKNVRNKIRKIFVPTLVTFNFQGILFKCLLPRLSRLQLPTNEEFQMYCPSVIRYYNLGISL